MNQEDTDLLPDLRQYLNNHVHQQKPLDTESELVKSLKHELSLAARAGQKLLMALQAAEEAKTNLETQVKNLARENAVISAENRRLLADHEILSESLEMQDSELASLIQRLAEVNSKAEKLSKVATTVKALEREVEMLQLQASQPPSKQELAMESRRIERLLTTQSNTSHLETSMEVPSLIADDSNDTFNTTLASDYEHEHSHENSHEHRHEQEFLPNQQSEPLNKQSTKDIDFAGSKPLNPILEGLEHDDVVDIQPKSMATPVKSLLRSQSHESVLTLANTPSKLVQSDNQSYENLMPTVCQSKPIITAPTPSSVVEQHKQPRTSARDHLRQFADKEREPRRWIFTPFRR